MIKKSLLLVVLSTAYLSGCASVPMASKEEDSQKKQFAAPSQGMSGIYIFRNSSFGAALTKLLYVDDQVIGASAANTYFYSEVKPGEHKLSTQTEFGNNHLKIKTEGDKNYYVRQYIKIGAFVGGAGLEQYGEEKGKAGVRECRLAKGVGPAATLAEVPATGTRPNVAVPEVVSGKAPSLSEKKADEVASGVGSAAQ